MKKLDVNVSPLANIMTFRLGFTHVTFDLAHMTFDCDPYDPCMDLHGQPDGQTDRQTYRCKAMHKSPPCTSMSCPPVGRTGK